MGEHVRRIRHSSVQVGAKRGRFWEVVVKAQLFELGSAMFAPPPPPSKLARVSDRGARACARCRAHGMRSDARTAAPDGRVRKSFPPLLPQPIADARRNLHFFTRVSFLFASYKSFQAQTQLRAWITRADQAAIDAAWSKQHDWGGRALYRLACDLKGYHLKGCQWLGSAAGHKRHRSSCCTFRSCRIDVRRWRSRRWRP